jgi:hypothetical protein
MLSEINDLFNDLNLCNILNDYYNVLQFTLTTTFFLVERYSTIYPEMGYKFSNISNDLKCIVEDSSNCTIGGSRFKVYELKYLKNKITKTLVFENHSHPEPENFREVRKNITYIEGNNLYMLKNSTLYLVIKHITKAICNTQLDTNYEQFMTYHNYLYIYDGLDVYKTNFDGEVINRYTIGNRCHILSVHFNSFIYQDSENNVHINKKGVKSQYIHQNLIRIGEILLNSLY